MKEIKPLKITKKEPPKNKELLSGELFQVLLLLCSAVDGDAILEDIF